MKYIKLYEQKIVTHYLYPVNEDNLVDTYEYLINVNAEPRICKKLEDWRTFRHYYDISPVKKNIPIYFKYYNEDLTVNVNSYIVNRSYELNDIDLKKLIFDIKKEKEVKLQITAKKYNL